MIESVKYEQQTPYKNNRKLFHKLLYGLRFFWTIIIVYIPYGFFEIFTVCLGQRKALDVLYATPILALGLSLTLRHFKKGKSLAILLAVLSVFYCKYQTFSFLIISIETMIAGSFYSFLNGLYDINWPLILWDVFSILFGIYSLYYLWIKCDYQFLMSIGQSVNLVSDKLKRLLIVKKIMIFLSAIQIHYFKLIGVYRIILACWPLGVFYITIFKLNINLNPTFQQMILMNVVFISSLILSTALYTVIRSNILMVLLAISGNMGMSIYYMTFFILKTFKQFNKSLHLFQLLKVIDWYLMALHMLPFVASVMAIRYLWSKSDFSALFKFKAFKKTDNFGSAKFADSKSIKKMNHPKGFPIGAISRILDGKSSTEIVACIKKHGGQEIIRIQTSHATLIAPSRTGKGAGVIIPTLLEYPGSVFVTDVKGENYAVTKRARELMNRQVIAFDPFGITDSSRVTINPLKFLNPNSIEIVNDSETIANLICPIDAHGSGNAKHFQSQASAVVQCLLLYVSCSSRIAEKNRNLSYVYDLLCFPLEELLNLIREIGGEYTLAHGSAARLANSILGTHPEERSGIFSTARVEMRFIDTPQVRLATKSLISFVEEAKNSDENNRLETHDSMGPIKPNTLTDNAIIEVFLADITKGEMDLFVCIPLEKIATQHRLLRLFTGIIFIEMQKARGKIGKENLLMVLDEMPALGYMKQIEEMLVYGGGFGISLLVISQTIEFLQSVYPKTWRTFFSNQLSIFFACSEEMTSRFVSEKLGKVTVKVASLSQSAGNQTQSFALLGTSSNQSGDSLSETGRPLLMPEEIEKLGDRVALAFKRGEDPIICHRIDYRERIEWRGLWDENPLHANRVQQTKFSFKNYFKEMTKILLN